MNQQETKTIEQTIGKLNETITELTYQKTELEMRISELETMKAALMHLLPTEKRIEQLFS